MRDLSRLSLVLALCTLLSVSLSVLPARADLIINEVLGDPARDWDGDGELNYRDDEWVEILNTGPESVDLGEYWLRDDNDSEPHIQLTGVLAAGDVLVVFGSDVMAWQSAHGQTAIGLSLNNNGDAVDLLRTVSGDTGPVLEVVDRVVVLDHEVEDDRSSGRHAETGGWVLFDGLNPYEGSLVPEGTECEPSPGAVNDCTINVATETGRWGALKSRYRTR